MGRKKRESNQDTSERRGNHGCCESCEESLQYGDYHAPWEDGDNAYGYVVCPHCGHKNYRIFD